MSESAWGYLKDEQKEGTITPSQIAEMAKSAKHYYSSYVLQEREPTPAMEEGIMFHKYLLEPEEFDKYYAVPPLASLTEGALKTGDDLKDRCKAFGLKQSGTKAEMFERIKEVDPSARSYDEIMASYLNGRDQVSDSMYKRLSRSKEEVSKHPFANRLILGKGDNEVPGYFVHKETGKTIRFRMDKVYKLNGRYVVVDLKRTANVNRRQFESNIYDLKLHVLASLYIDAIKAITGESALFAWVAIQPTSPFLVSTFVADFGALEAGREEATQAIIAIDHCKKTGVYPGPDETLINCSLPSWAWSKIEAKEMGL